MNKKNVLLVDDETINHFISERILRSSEWFGKIYSAFNGREALAVIQDYCQGYITIPDLILLDLDMPLMNGLQFIEQFNALECLQGKQQQIVIAVLSSSVNPAEYLQVRAMGVRHIIPKPISSQHLDALAEIEFKKEGE